MQMRHTLFLTLIFSLAVYTAVRRFVRHVSTVVVTVTDPTCWDTTCAVTLELVLAAPYTLQSQQKFFHFGWDIEILRTYNKQRLDCSLQRRVWAVAEGQIKCQMGYAACKNVALTIAKGFYGLRNQIGRSQDIITGRYM